MRYLVIFLCVLLTQPDLPAQKRFSRQPPKLSMEVPPDPDAPCCLDIKISKWAGPNDPNKASDITSEILGTRISSRMSVWVVSMVNRSPTDTIRVSEATVLGRLDTINPYSHIEVEMLMDRGTKLDKWFLAGQFIVNIGFLLALPVFSNLLTVSLGLKNALAGFISASPYIVTQLNNRAIPVRDNFNRIEWFADIDLKPGDSVVAHIFSERWDVSPSAPMQIHMNTSNLGMVRVAR